MRVDEDMAALAAPADAAVDRQIADEDAAADPLSQGQDDDALEAAACADPTLGVGRGDGVVDQRRRQAAMAAHTIAQGKSLPPWENGRAYQDAGGDVHRAGQGQSDTSRVSRLQPGCFDRPQRERSEFGAAGLGTAIDLGGLVQPGKQSAGIIHDAGADVVLPELNSDKIRRSGLGRRNERVLHSDLGRPKEIVSGETRSIWVAGSPGKASRVARFVRCHVWCVRHARSRTFSP